MNKVYSIITDQILEAMESTDGTDWTCPWRTTSAMPLRQTGEQYRGINVLLLWIAAQRNGYSSPYYLTYKGAKRAGGQVRGGEHGQMVTFYKDYKAENADGEEESRMVLRYYKVFNAEQCDGLPARFYPSSDTLPDVVRDTSADVFAADCGARIEHGGERSCYIPSADLIRLPNVAAFESQAGYDGTLLHELSHWTGHKSRLDRQKANARFGNSEYAFEELIAELGATFLCSQLGKEYVLEHHASYLAHWVKLLKSNPKAIVQAASKAQKAADYCLEASSMAEAA